MPLTHKGREAGHLVRGGGEYAYAVRGDRIVFWSGGDDGLVLLTPAMTSNTTPTPFVISAGSQHGTNAAFCAFDQLQRGVEDSWHSAANPGANAWLQIDLGVTRTLSKYNMRTRGGVETALNTKPYSWTLSGSDAGAVWTAVDTQTAVSWPNNATNSPGYQLLEFSLPASVDFRFFRFTFDLTGSGRNYVSVGEIELYGLAA